MTDFNHSVLANCRCTVNNINHRKSVFTKVPFKNRPQKKYRRMLSKISFFFPVKFFSRNFRNIFSACVQHKRVNKLSSKKYFVKYLWECSFFWIVKFYPPPPPPSKKGIYFFYLSNCKIIHFHEKGNNEKDFTNIC